MYALTNKLIIDSLSTLHSSVDEIGTSCYWPQMAALCGFFAPIKNTSIVLVGCFQAPERVAGANAGSSNLHSVHRPKLGTFSGGLSFYIGKIIMQSSNVLTGQSPNKKPFTDFEQRMIGIIAENLQV